MSKRDDERLVELYRREYGSLARYARLVTLDGDHADDLAQEAFLRLGLRRRWSERIVDPPAYLRRTVVNLARDHARSRSRRIAREERVAEAPIEPAVDAGLDDGLDLAAPDLERLLTDLSPQQRAVVVLRFFEDRSVEDTAACLDLAVGTVKAHTHRALGRLRVGLIAQGGSA